MDEAKMFPKQKSRDCFYAFIHKSMLALSILIILLRAEDSIRPALTNEGSTQRCNGWKAFISASPTDDVLA